MKRLYIKLLLALFLSSVSAFAQQLPVFNQYLFNPYVYNPARAGASELGSLFIGQRKQWSDVPFAPDSRLLTLEMPLPFDRKSGVGLTMFNDVTHIINKFGASLTYSYHVPLDDEQNLSFGVSGGFLNQRIDFGDANVQFPGDPALLNANTASTTFDVGFGMYYRFKNLSIDLSVPQLSNSNVRYLSNTGSVSTFSLVSHYLGAIRYRIPLGVPKLQRDGKEHEIHLEPVFMLRGAQDAPFQYDANLMFSWYNQFWFGGGFRSGGQDYFTSSANLFMGIRVADLVLASYSYEFATQSADRTSLGNTHEFSLGFRFGRTQGKVLKLEDELRMMEARQQNLMDSLNNIKPSTVDDPEYVDDGDRVAGFDPDMLRTYDMMKKMEDLERLQQLEDMQRLEELRKLKEYEEYQRLSRMKDLDQANIPDSERRKVELAMRGDTEVKFEKIGSVYFKVNESELSDVAKAELRSIRDIIRSKERVYTVYVAGNASVEGTSVYNLVLSNRRAITVKNYLLNIGMDDTIVLPIPYGAENPITQDQEFEAEKEKNRRVDVFVIGGEE